MQRLVIAREPVTVFLLLFAASSVTLLVYKFFNMSTLNIKRSWVEEMDDPQDECKAKKVSKQGSSRENSNSRKKTKHRKQEGDAVNKSGTIKKPAELETDASVLQRRQKQIDYGKNTVGYHNYVTQVPTDKRTKEDPKTPDKFRKYSRRSWDTLIKMWRVNLHKYDTDPESGDSIELQIVDEDSSDE